MLCCPCRFQEDFRSFEERRCFDDECPGLGCVAVFEDGVVVCRLVLARLRVESTVSITATATRFRVEIRKAGYLRVDEGCSIFIDAIGKRVHWARLFTACGLENLICVRA